MATASSHDMISYSPAKPDEAWPAWRPQLPATIDRALTGQRPRESGRKWGDAGLNCCHARQSVDGVDEAFSTVGRRWLQHGQHARQSVDRGGVTIVELMVSVALTLIVVLAIVRVFDMLGGSVTASRSILELSAQLRSATTQMQQDLDRLTAHPAPPVKSQSSAGYLEIIEGVRRDADNDGDGQVNPNELDPNAYNLDAAVGLFGGGTPDTRFFNESDPFLREVIGTLGDTDDVLMGTVRSTDEPFRGQLINPATGRPIILESPVAEIIYWIQAIPGVGTNTTSELVISRRRLLVLPTPAVRQQLRAISVNLLGLSLPLNNTDGLTALHDFLWHNDVSVRPEYENGRLILVPNTLEDLQLRRSRFGHWPDVIEPNPVPDERQRRMASFRATGDRLNRRFLQPPPLPNADRTRHLFVQGALAFDLRVYDPLAPLFRPVSESGTPYNYVVAPTDPGFANLVANLGVTAADGYGAFVDLGYAHAFDSSGSFSALPPNIVRSHFSSLPSNSSRILSTGTSVNLRLPRVYDTWTTRYQQDGISQNPGPVDSGRDSLDNNNNWVTDEPEEAEVVPPYAHPLRGLEVIFRVREVSSQQVRQASLVTDFVSP